ncbi:MAG: hypothetical protein A2Y03_10630 [Omnitrophica WOR_2 bacterium GWF2_38_59]|nr:MAG: hypothetical protein A2Y03_10630 [Omnitrophica WOR_2 bacterium GWF2_38_59]OGX52231.1 MAG: hypothetical protein A2267_01480 [Omnitrophica WOR_2 bacterium RIFOXYA12_FULL_38_10]OGX55008.1 MAG: hypothetical protein A2447_10700 [Omnitrophica WOR_2 bacterium RIFOXYC2_FULL_38_12]OGX55189.1 MAG: hypothetical protein A2306_02495 [Omnitrophica WOR_2 bacterium RIFOXYB2_FULL_38_16]HBG61668.1 hypothetical protein [Candidatus Omnitrophota bacterium]
MLQSIKICYKHSRFIDGRKNITFDPGFNVVVGPNGSGKSTLLESIYKCPDCEKVQDNDQVYQYFNSETMNPHRSEEYFDGINGSIIRVRAMFSSHGETMRDVLRYIGFKKGDCLLLDEPESGHDLSWIIRIRKGLNEICKKGCQVIVASHHPAFFNDAKIIELRRGYVARTLKKLKKLVSI